uniref:Nucleotide binding PilT domain-containing protein n=1 Tax=uncultured marine group II/III euryarchaeote AD1000_99_D12 TaxID=1457831 RepID=A0A075G1J1_9EURY|nr:nucleotide binding PilT domain-containing protein [uncultured marine group II/III euryarchaeote AD1000_99_D12]
MKTVLVDTNIILWTFCEGPDFRKAIAEIAPGYDVAVPSCVISELEKLGTKHAKTALKYCKTLDIIDIGRGYADKMLIQASENGYIIATNDKELLEELGKRGLNALRIRGKTQLIPTESELI